MIGVAILAIIVIAIVFSTSKRPRSPASTTSQPSATTTRATTFPNQRPGTFDLSPVTIGTQPEIPPAQPGNKATTLKYVSLRPDQTLAAVNGVPITLKDLVPTGVADAGQEKTMSYDVFKSLLERAIDRELAFQAAAAEGIQLTDAQQAQLQEHRASLQNPYPQYRMISPAQVDPARIDFELRDAQGLMLQQALMEKVANASPLLTDAQVQQYYQEHAAEFGDLPVDPQQRAAAWEKIDLAIRQQQAPRAQAEYQMRLKEYLDKLKAQSQINAAQLIEPTVAANAATPVAPATP